MSRGDPAHVLKEWTERDLTAAARAGELAPAFEVDDHLRRVADVLASGRHPVLCGESGVGKSAIVHELVRRAEAGSAPPALAGKRVLQISLRSRNAALLKPELMRPAMQKLVDALVASADTVVPFFRDLHLAYELDLEPQLQLLALRMRGGAVLGEADALTFDRMLEGTPGLEQHFVGLGIVEPDLAKMEAILARWADQQRATGRTYTPAALREAVQLAHRFLARARMPRKVIDFLATVGSLVEPGRAVLDADVMERFFEAYKVPRFLIDPSVPFDLEATERAFRARVLGQAEAVRTVVRMISLIKSGLSDTRRPFGVFLFVGPTGVGKTHVAQLLAEYLFGSRERVIRLNMADYGNPGDAYTLFGNADAYNTRQRRGLLTQRLAGHPFGVLLLDEFEKANEKVHDRFLQLFDEGAFINGEGETISCRSLILIATSNAGAEVYRGRPLGFASSPDVDALDRELDRLVYRHFRFELLNRFDEVVRFRPLSREDIRTIALREIEALRERSGLKARGLQLEVDEAILDWLTAHGYDPHFGARFLRRTIERNVTMALAEAIVREPIEPGTRIALRIRGARIAASVVEPDDRERPEALRVPEGTRSKRVTLDRKALGDEARALLAAARDHLERHEVRKEEASGLLALMGAPGFWDDPADAQRVLDGYRTLDVAVQAEARLAEPLRRLAELLDGSNARTVKTEWLARAVEQASAALIDWEERAAEQGGGAVWLLLRNADPLEPASQWLEELAAMELAWCRRLGLSAEVAAVGLAEEALARVVIEVEGPGAATYMAMERGAHRLHRERGDLRVRIDVVPRVPAGDPRRSRLTAVKRRSGALGIDIVHLARVERDEMGLLLDLGGASEPLLDAMAADLERCAADLVAPVDTARIYGQGGTGARDPRTGGVVSRLKDVMRGGLDPLLEAWRRVRRAERAAPVT